MPGGDAADRLADEQLLVRCTQRGCVRGRDLVLAVPEFGVILLESNPLRVERRDELVEKVLCRGGADRREAQSGIDRDELAVHASRKRELVLERNLERRGAYGSTRNVSGSGTSRISPTGPIPSTGCSWSSVFIACIATVSPIPLRMRPSSPSIPLALARTVPSFPHQRKRTRRRSASCAFSTTSCALTPPASRSASAPRAGGCTR